MIPEYIKERNTLLKGNTMKSQLYLSTLLRSFPIFLIISTACVKGPAVNDREPEVPVEAVSLNSLNFGDTVCQQETVALVEFYSPSCLTCSALSWIIDSLAALRGNEAVIGVVNTEPEFQLTDDYSITSIPAFLFFKDGEEIARRTYIQADSTAFDTLSSLLDRLIEGTLAPESGDTVAADTAPAESIVMLLSAAQFDSVLTAENRLFLADFFSTGCSYCSILEPVLDTIKTFYQDLLFVGKINAGNDAALRTAYEISAYPTMIFFLEGNEVHRIRGAKTTQFMTAVVDSLLNRFGQSAESIDYGA